MIPLQNSKAGTDDVLVKVGLKHDPGFDVIKELKDSFRSRIRVTPEIEICPAQEIHAVNYPPTGRKPVKFIDQRK